MQRSDRRFGLIIFFLVIMIFPLVFTIPFYSRLSQQDVLTRVADYTMNELDYSIFTDWGKGICMHGLLDAYNVTENEKYLSFAQYWVDQSIRTQTADGSFGHGEFKVGDSTAIGLSVLYFLNQTGDRKYRDAAIKHLNYLRSPEQIWVNGSHLEGGLSHTHNRPELWIDHLYMVMPFWAKMGVLLGNDTYINESIHQVYMHLKHLWDPATNLCVHIWSETEGYLDPYLWGRGIGWATAAIARMLDIIPETHANYSYLLDTVLLMLASLGDYQDPVSGLWHTIVNDTSTYLETSCSTLFAYTVAKLYNINATWINAGNKTMAIEAFNAVVQKVDNYGVVHWCTGGTGANPYDVPRTE
ncbi:MAG: glycoside hydrolase family 88 protein, partial [Candidatus Helarchaeota archaeon]|nr:glycoside hydrolase family 88 protein [Candidatus Helarchaeota archaeon]